MVLFLRVALTNSLTSGMIGKRRTKKTFDPRFAMRLATYRFTPEIRATTMISVETERTIPSNIRNERSVCAQRFQGYEDGHAQVDSSLHEIAPVFYSIRGRPRKRFNRRSFILKSRKECRAYMNCRTEIQFNAARRGCLGSDVGKIATANPRWTWQCRRD